MPVTSNMKLARPRRRDNESVRSLRSTADANDSSTMNDSLVKTPRQVVGQES